MPYPPLSLIKRLVKGSKVTPAEEDQNMTDIETGVNAQLAQLAVSLTPAGLLKPNSVATTAIQDRAVTLAKLAFLSNFYAVDTGGANAMAISFTPALGAYVAGLVFWVKAAASNTGVTTLNVNTLGVQTVKQYTGAGILDLVAGNIIAGNVYALVHDGTNFVLINPTETGALAKGVPVYLAAPVPITIPNPLTASTAGWVTYNAFASGVPITASAVILQCKTYFESNDPGGSTWEVFQRPNAGGPTNQLAFAVSGTNTGGGNLAFAILPLHYVGVGNISFDYEATLTGTVIFANCWVYVIGYIQ